MDRQPRTISGLFAPERNGDQTFAWSGGRVSMALEGIDRRAPWLCRAAVINWRPPSAGPATVRIEVDGRTIASRQIADPAAEIAFAVDPAPERARLHVGLAIAPTFKPGPQDPRDLGLAFDAIRCEPAGGARPWPPARSVWRGALAAAMAGAIAGVAGLPLAPAVAAGVVVAGVQAIPLARGELPYVPDALPVIMLAGLLAVFCLAPILFAEVVLRRTLGTSARLAVVVSGGAAYLKLLFLLHPDKPLVDALFHAHRFEWVLAGRFFFTQLSTSATPFPYAIGLYLFAAPWAWLTSDHVTLLRVVVYAAEAAAGLLLYPVIVRAWNDRAAGVIAVVLFHLVPLPYTVIGNANLTNAFGQSAALVTMAAASSWTLRPGQYGQIAGLTLLATLAFLSHVGTVAVLLPILIALAAYHCWPGGAALRPQARSIAVATLLAAILATLLYYGRFGEVYAPAVARAAAGGSAREALPLRLGVSGAFQQIRVGLGWPVMVLAAIGAWRAIARRRADRLSLALLAWTTVAVAFLGLSALRTVDPRYVQDAWEFIGRVLLGTYPAIVILAAIGASWAWRAHPALRAAAIAMVGLAAISAARAIAAWFT